MGDYDRKKFLKAFQSAVEPEVMEKIINSPKMRKELGDIREWMLRRLGLSKPKKALKKKAEPRSDRATAHPSKNGGHGAI